VLQEPIAPSTLLGTALVIGGIALVNSRFGTRTLFAGRGAAPTPITTGTGRS
jgi:drug/metabolite transporter (DMT)-like permease